MDLMAKSMKEDKKTLKLSTHLTHIICIAHRREDCPFGYGVARAPDGEEGQSSWFDYFDFDSCNLAHSPQHSA